ncbi:MAG: NUDIX domain-containing protein [Leptolyngbyaceae cyanobacterium bins.302]|nr:NUDIX domain-containing protein [Leptolyngbyaceae cyanobacterium bins.302]
MTQDLTHQPSQPVRPIVALAILHQDGKFLMQLRDDNPNIFYPGHWAFFGGHLELGETAEVGLRRELIEEIGYCPAMLTPYDRYDDTHIIRYIFHGELDLALSQLILGEGMDLDLLTLEDIQRGDRYSQKINQTRPIGKPHQKILLDFIQHKG